MMTSTNAHVVTDCADLADVCLSADADTMARGLSALRDNALTLSRLLHSLRQYAAANEASDAARFYQLTMNRALGSK